MWLWRGLNSIGAEVDAEVEDTEVEDAVYCDCGAIVLGSVERRRAVVAVVVVED